MDTTTIATITSIGLGGLLAYNGWNYFVRRGKDSDKITASKDQQLMTQNDEMIKDQRDTLVRLEQRMDKKDDQYVKSLDNIVSVFRKDSQDRNENVRDLKTMAEGELAQIRAGIEELKTLAYKRDSHPCLLNRRKDDEVVK